MGGLILLAKRRPIGRAAARDALERVLRIPHVIWPDRGAKQINVPWATLGSGFTLLFKELAMTLMTAMPGIKQVCIDMSAAFIKGVTGNLPVDKLCAVKLANDAVDKVRRTESKGRPELKRSRSIWLRNEPSLSAGGRRQPAALTKLHLKTERAYQIRRAFKEIYRQPKQGWGALFLDRGQAWAIRSRQEPIKHAARSIKRHRDGILALVRQPHANSLIGGTNSLAHAAKPGPATSARPATSRQSFTSSPKSSI